jgi:uncharacterized membrane protein YfcA
VTSASPLVRAIGVGAVCGVASGLLGIGGAVIMVPLLVAVLGLSQHRAHGTSLVVTIFTATAAVIGYARGGHLDFALALTLVAGSIIGSPLGARWAQATSAATLRRAFGLLIVLVGVRLFLVNLPEGQLLPTEDIAGTVAHVLMGFAVGVMSGFFGVGGGVVLIPALVLLSGVPQHTAQGVSLLFIIPTAIVGGWTHHRLGNVDTRNVLPLALGSAGLAFLGSLVASSLPALTLRILFGCLLVIVGLRLALVARKRTSKTEKQSNGSAAP